MYHNATGSATYANDWKWRNSAQYPHTTGDTYSKGIDTYGFKIIRNGGDIGLFITLVPKDL